MATAAISGSQNENGQLPDLDYEVPDVAQQHRFAGVVTDVIYNGFREKKEISGSQFCILKVMPGASHFAAGRERKPVKIVGGFWFEPKKGEEIEVFGQFEKDTFRKNVTATYQFRAKTAFRQMPITPEGAFAYLAKGGIKGVGQETATRLYRHFGPRLLEALDKPEIMEECESVAPEMRLKVSTSWQALGTTTRAIPFLMGHEIGRKIAERVVEWYGQRTWNIVTSNPWRLAVDIEGIGFQKADNIALSMGRSLDSDDRIIAGIAHALMDNCQQDGHCFLPREGLIQRAAAVLKVSEGQVSALYSRFLSETPVIEEVVDDRGVVVYPKVLYDAEITVANRLSAILQSQKQIVVDPDELDRLIQASFIEAGLEYDESQENAVRNAILNGVSIITGGPGTGKTSTMRVVVAVLQALGYTEMEEYAENVDGLWAMSPTGKASRRLAKSIGRSATTMHSALGLTPGGRPIEGRTGKMDGRVFIIDEGSMPDIRLMAAFFSGIPDDARVIIVGDEDQLPSIDSGQVFTDLMNSGAIPVARLNVTHRAAKESAIVAGAMAIKNGDWEGLKAVFGKLDGSVTFTEIPNVYGEAARNEVEAKAVQQAVNVMTVGFPKKKGIQPINTTIFSPMKSYTLGIRNINEKVAAVLNPRGPSTPLFQTRNNVYAPGDRVLQLKNNGDLDISNGDLGVIQGFVATSEDDINMVEKDGLWYLDHGNGFLEPAKTTPVLKMQVKFDEPDERGNDRVVNLSAAMAADTEFGNAMTIHKGQGSEAEGVILVIGSGHSRMLFRNLFYTGFTRGKRHVHIIGSVWAIKKAIETPMTNTRNTLLARRIRHSVPMLSAAPMTAAIASDHLVGNHPDDHDDHVIDPPTPEQYQEALLADWQPEF